MNAGVEDSAGMTFVQQIDELWIAPALEARGDDPGTAVSKAIIVFPAEGPTKVLLDDEAALIADGVAARQIAEGEAVTGADLKEIRWMRPYSIDPNAGWIAVAETGEGRLITFDLRRNRSRAEDRLDRAREYLASASDDVQKDRLGPAVDSCWAAAELASDAHMLVFDHSDGRPQHDEKRKWMRGWSELGNVPIEHSRCLSELGKFRSRARYGGRVKADRDRIAGWIQTTSAMIEFAAANVAPARELEPLDKTT